MTWASSFLLDDGWAETKKERVNGGVAFTLRLRWVDESGRFSSSAIAMVGGEYPHKS